MLPVVFLCSEEKIVLFSGSKDAQIALHTPIIVVTDVVGDHLDKFLLACKSLAVIALTLQNAPEPLHRAVVDAFGHTRHTLCHSSFLQLVVECSVCILKPSIRMKDRVSTRIYLHGLVKGLECKRVIVSISDDERDDASII